MKRFSKIFYQILGSVTTYIAMLSIVQLNSFCLLIIHQPNIPQKLQERYVNK